jgi:hypothetical protein
VSIPEDKESNSGDALPASAEDGSGVAYILGGGRTLIFTKRRGVWGVYFAKENKMKQKALHFPKEILDWFVSTFSSTLEAASALDMEAEADTDAEAAVTQSIQILTELTISKNGTGVKELLRAHPNFRSEGPWYDFVEIDYGEEDGFYPARCACFFEWPEGVTTTDVYMEDLGHLSAGTALVLIHECLPQSKEELAMDSLLYSHYTLHCKKVRHKNGGTVTTSPVLECVHPQNINGRLYVIDPLPGPVGIFGKETNLGKDKEPPPFRIIKVKDRTSQWPNAFIGLPD